MILRKMIIFRIMILSAMIICIRIFNIMILSKVILA
jgi:hypothetical protein